MAVFAKCSKPFKSHPGSHRWPLVHKAVVSQLADFLKSGLVLADLPRVADLNQTVVDSTRDYLRGCGTVLVFAARERILTNETLDANLKLCIRLHKTRNVQLVVTKIDDNNPFSESDRYGLPAEDQKRLEHAESEVGKLQAKEQSLNVLRKEALARKDWQRYAKISEEVEQLPNLVAAAKAQVAQVTIDSRNREVQQRLKQTLRDLSRDNTLPDLVVHFIGNKAYQKHLEGYDPRGPPPLYLAGTGLPALRQTLFGLPAQGK
ncbi:hypothetical protein BAUCODRAFT_473331 [Baudoinia panamericana UAMH 10762]|uniref:Uncharacterized protein n=1 Tax=Baudoinia panamericana (strain UAMH 10762) TaxID=717646 RepID=M2MXV0_BAUPA|nr:uncharacterized protein BAUCODRAFT_473331 [Baudoinia panamericana UAMH 10762]EMC96398.1 hypothetical protein BAUCODRAFT_473331 [Baudoinia panamericana UAMH 10762]